MSPKKQFLALAQVFRPSMLMFSTSWHREKITSSFSNCGNKYYIKSGPKTRKNMIFHQFPLHFTSKFRLISKFSQTPQFEKGTTSSEENENINFRRIPPPKPLRQRGFLCVTKYNFHYKNNTFFKMDLNLAVVCQPITFQMSRFDVFCFR